MLLTGELVIHKTDNVTRECVAAYVMKDGSIAVWDSLPEADWYWDGQMIYTSEYEETAMTRNMWEPDIIAGPDQYDRVERKGHPWKHHTPSGLKQLARERDDVDADEVPNNL